MSLQDLKVGDDYLSEICAKIYDGTTGDYKLIFNRETGKLGVAKWNGSGWDAEGYFKLIPDDDWHEVGAVGEPVFTADWETDPTDPLMFKKEGDAILIKGKAVVKEGVSGAADAVVVTLPDGYEPATDTTDSALKDAVAGIQATLNTNKQLRLLNDMMANQSFSINKIIRAY